MLTLFIPIHKVKEAKTEITLEDLRKGSDKALKQVYEENRDKFQKHFGALGKKCQELLTLFYYRGYTIQEIMEAENYNSENVVKAAKSRCMKTLRERIQANNSH